MRHRVKSNSLSRFSSYRKATIRSIVISILLNEKIITTKAKAKVARSAVEKAISLGKTNTLAGRRRAFALLGDHALVKTLFDEIAPKFSARNGGYTRIISYRNRRGDNAHVVVFELTETYKSKKPHKDKEAKKEKPSKEKAVSKKQLSIDHAQEVIKEPDEVKEEEGVTVKKEPEPKKREPHVVESEAEEKKEESTEKDEKREKKFLGGFKSLFRKDKDSHK